ncbi:MULTISPECIES: DUF6412 domain-containing protein [unclassified Streptomyces]|uniref:DUF6412 domain-containing protein n=1 Tax=unclassified Streptomyces TaxID=2593676 RepID=UPI002E2B5843|nr:DUF6412 domain-containing protein [Streptomyces sp. NBC_01439]
MARQRRGGRLLSYALFARISWASRISRALALLLPLVLLGGFLGLFAGEGGLGAVVVALAATVAVGTAALAAAARLVRPVPPHRIRTAIRDREQRTAFLPQRDPDASGRSRPRAPGRLVPTAA